jgi:hypothetical protein
MNKISEDIHMNITGTYLDTCAYTWYVYGHVHTYIVMCHCTCICMYVCVYIYIDKNERM